MITIIGFIGALIILIAFILNQIGKLHRNSIAYDFANFIGGLLMVIYAYLIKSYPFLLLNGIWTLVSLKDVIMDIMRKNKT